MLRAQPMNAKPTVLANGQYKSLYDCIGKARTLAMYSKQANISVYRTMQNDYANMAKNNIQTSIFPSIYGIPSTCIPCFGMKWDELDIWIDRCLLANFEITGECFPLISNADPENPAIQLSAVNLARLLCCFFFSLCSPSCSRFHMHMSIELTPSWILSANFAWTYPDIREDRTQTHRLHPAFYWICNSIAHRINGSGYGFACGGCEAHRTKPFMALKPTSN